VRIKRTFCNPPGPAVAPRNASRLCITTVVDFVRFFHPMQNL
jgi:hypothetical protein